MSAWQIAGVGWILNVLGMIAHAKFARKDPTHEDVVETAMFLFSFVPFLTFGIVCLELTTGGRK